MRRREIYRDEDEEEPLYESTQEERSAFMFRNKPRKVESGSTEKFKIIDNSVNILKVVTVIVAFCTVLGTAILSKISLLFMTSQINKNITRAYCNKDIDRYQQFEVSLPNEERVVWIWFIIFAYIVPEMGTLVRSIRVLCFKTWQYPTLGDFFSLFITETLPTIGSAFLVFIVLPELDAIKGAMLTNAVCFVPGFVTFFSRNPKSLNSTIKIALDILALIAQASAFIVWPLVEEKPILYMIPVSVVLISIGWWENYTTEKSPIPFIRNIAKSKKEFQNKNYFMYAFIAPWKCLVFLSTALVVILLKEGTVDFLFSDFSLAFSPHNITIKEIVPVVGGSGINYTEAVTTGYGKIIVTSIWTPLGVWLINILTTYFCYAFAKFSCKIMIQTSGFALPVNMSVPFVLTILIAMCGEYSKDECVYSGVIPEYLFFNLPSITYLNAFISHQHSWIWLMWLLSQAWITFHIWTNQNQKLASTERLFFRPMYDPFLIDQSVALNRRRVQNELIIEEESIEDIDPLEVDKDKITKIYACGTMWHETKEEMVEFLKSIMRMDEDQCAHRIVRNYLQFNHPKYYELETHILFDDAYVRVCQDDEDPHVNQYVLDLIDSVSEAASEVHKTNLKIKPPIVYPTPYGGRLVWTLPGKTKMIAHLKDKAKIRPKKRWSQVMYMYYLLGFRIMENDELTPERIPIITESTYLLALDGDIDFQPEAVHLLIDYMKKNKTLGATCGRIHPIGSGAMAWYQIFEYAVGHWLQKATEHVVGCVLCSPGCFSLFRAKALMDDNVMAKYTTISTEPIHYVQYDQGEDRWLCTLLLQRGYRVEYSAASDAYTHCPEGFNEFYNQRRRWMPSTTANIMDVLSDYQHILKVNDNISKPYIFYQIMLMIGTALGPGTIFLMLVGAFVAAFKIGQWASLMWNLLPILIFIIVCATCKADTQLLFAGIFSGVYGLVMMAVLVGIMMQITTDGWLAPSSLFLFMTAGEFIFTALMHPKEFYCLKYGIIYYVTVPCMYLLLVLYSIFNMNNVSWGTREVTVLPNPEIQEPALNKPQEKDNKDIKNKIFSFFGNNKDDAGSIEFSLAGLFKIMCCTHKKDGEESKMLLGIQLSIEQLQHKLDQIERMQYAPENTEVRKTVIKGPIFREGPMPRPTINQLRNSMGSNIEQSLSMSYQDEDDLDSVLTPSGDVQNNSWFYDGELQKGEVRFLDKKEENFWKALLDKYLYPLDETSKKEKLAQGLKDLRDKMVITFLMINSLFVLVVFMLTLQKDILHLKWPINPKVNFTYYYDQNEIYITKTYLQLEPIGFVFLVFFFFLLVIQFIGMFYHRFGTFCQIMSNTTLDWSLFGPSKVQDMTENEILAKDPLKIFKKLIKLQHVNDDDEDDFDLPVARRNTVHGLALNKNKKKHIIQDLEGAFKANMNKMKNGSYKENNLPIPRRTLAAIEKRRDTIQRRKSQMPQIDKLNVPAHFQLNRPARMQAFDNPSFDDSEL